MKCISFPGATIEDMNDFIKPILKINPKKVIVHVGTNNIKKDKSKQIKQKLVKLVDEIKQEHPGLEIGISSILHRNDDPSLNLKVDQVNSHIEQYCHDKNFDFINNDNIISEKCLNRSGLHLNRQGSSLLAYNFRKFIN